MTVSVGVVAYNESNVINGILEDLAKQDYPHENIELLLVDSASTDDTGKQLEAFAARQAELGFKRIQVLDNPLHASVPLTPSQTVLHQSRSVFQYESSYSVYLLILRCTQADQGSDSIRHV